MVSYRAGQIAWKIIRFLLLFGIIFTLLYPILFMLVTAFRGLEDVYNPSVAWITRHWTLEHITYFLELDEIDFWNVFGYTFVISLGGAVLQTAICSTVGYGFARFKFPGRGVFFALVIFTIIVPVQTYLSQLFIDFRYFSLPQFFNVMEPLVNDQNLIGTPWPYWLQAAFGMGFRAGLFIFIFRQFYRGLPVELDDAARIDGCSSFRTYLVVMLPNAISAIVTVFMFSFVWHWNDHATQSFLSMGKNTLSMLLSHMHSTLATASSTGWGQNSEMIVQVRVQAGALVTIAPMLILFAFGQRFFTESIERTGIVG